MIDFRKEILKYKPILEVEEIETSINSDEIEDLIDVLKKFSDKSYNINKVQGEI